MRSRMVLTSTATRVRTSSSSSSLSCPAPAQASANMQGAPSCARSTPHLPPWRHGLCSKCKRAQDHGADLTPQAIPSLSCSRSRLCQGGMQCWPLPPLFPWPQPMTGRRRACDTHSSKPQDDSNIIKDPHLDEPQTAHLQVQGRSAWRGCGAGRCWGAARQLRLITPGSSLGRPDQRP